MAEEKERKEQDEKSETLKNKNKKSSNIVDDPSKIFEIQTIQEKSIEEKNEENEEGFYVQNPNLLSKGEQV